MPPKLNSVVNPLRFTHSSLGFTVGCFTKLDPIGSSLSIDTKQQHGARWPWWSVRKTEKGIKVDAVSHRQFLWLQIGRRDGEGGRTRRRSNRWSEERTAMPTNGECATCGREREREREREEAAIEKQQRETERGRGRGAAATASRAAM